MRPFSRKPPSVDAVNELEKLDQQQQPHQLQQVVGAHTPGRRALSWVLMIILICILLGLFLSSNKERELRQAESNTVAVGNVLGPLKLPEDPDPVPPLPAPPPAAAPSLLSLPPAPTSRYLPTVDLNMGSLQIDPVRSRRLKSPMRAQQPGQSDPPPADTSMPASTTRDSGPMADSLEGLQLHPSQARLLTGRDLLITQGSSIDCVLVTRIVTTQPGMLTCTVPIDVYSSNGATRLIAAGSRLTGYQKGGLKQGQARIFATWSLLETPDGARININSPGVGPLGEGGLSGDVDHHFWERFGNALLFSVIGDLSAYASNRQNSDNNTNTLRLDNTRSGAAGVVERILEQSLDIPPTLFKNHGERIGIMVARDLDFSTIYDPITRTIKQP